MRQSNSVPLIGLFFVLGCRDPAPSAPPDPAAPASRAAPTGLPAAAPLRPPPPARAAEDGGGAQRRPVAAHFARCATGYHPRTDARIDVRRLGFACGPSNGMVRWGESMHGRISEIGDEGKHTLAMDADRCVRLALVADPGVKDLEVELLVGGKTRARVTVEDRWALLPDSRPFCPDAPTRAEVVVRTHAGRGEYFLEGWRVR